MTKETVTELLRYDDGMVFWKVKPAKQIAAGVRAGTRMAKGYRIIKTPHGYFLEHRLVWIYFNGSIPEGMNIDHIDGDPSNNRIENLRIATFTQNMWNVKLNKSNKCGFKGVSYSKDKKKWIAQISANGTKKHLGYFDTPEQASEEYKRQSEKLHGDFSSYKNRICA